MFRFLILAMLMVAPAAFAQDAAGGGAKKNSVIDFEEDTIEGDLTRPDGEYIEVSKKVKHSNLIRVREEFKDKVMQSVDEL
jgi:hypothetical protein